MLKLKNMLSKTTFRMASTSSKALLSTTKVLVHRYPFSLDTSKFTKYNLISSKKVNLLKTNKTKRADYLLVEFGTPEDTQKAIKKLHGTLIEGQRMRLKPAPVKLH
jgi:RNA recognition motif. (a.k.a. RRM, RBD, or RNP domain)